MASLAQQLQTLKHAHRSTSVLPKAKQPSLLLPTHTASTTSPDIFFTMALIAYGELAHLVPNLKEHAEIVMSRQNCQIARNSLTKEANKKLSECLVRFMLKISPWFLHQPCQKILEYLLQNYKVNIFEAEPLAIIYLQFWNTKQYVQLISNIPPKILSRKLSFLSNLNPQSLNLTYLLKHLSYSHFLIQTLVLYTLEYLRLERVDNNVAMDIEIDIRSSYIPSGVEGKEGLGRADPRRFLLLVFNEFISRKMNLCFKYIFEFITKAVIGHPSVETSSMLMLLLTRLFIQDSLPLQFLQTIIAKLLGACEKQKQRAESSSKGFFDFVMIVWQRRPHCLTHSVLNDLEHFQDFKTYLGQFSCSIWMVLIDLMHRWREGHCYPSLLEAIGNKIKKQKFYHEHQQQFLEKLFQEFEDCLSGGRADGIITFVRGYFLSQMAHHYNTKRVAPRVKQVLLSTFPKQVIRVSKNQEVSCALELLPLQEVESSEEAKSFSQGDDSEIEQEFEEETPRKSCPLLEAVNSKGLHVQSIKYRDKSTCEKLKQLLSQFYEGEGEISRMQKNAILENMVETYTGSWFLLDLNQKDFILPVKYLAVTNDLNSSKETLNSLLLEPELLRDVLFRQLLRLSLKQVAQQMNEKYKSVVYYLNTFFKNMLARHLFSLETQQLSHILLTVSENTFGQLGVKRGKYHNLLHNHGKLIAHMILALKTKRTMSQNVTSEERIVLEHYLRTVRVFGCDQLYLLNIGIIENLTKKELEHGHLRNFISVLLGGVRESHYDYFSLVCSWAKTLIFCGQLNSCLAFKEGEIDPCLKNGIAKKAISDFLGLVKQKFKRTIIKKLLLFIRTVFSTAGFVDSFKLALPALSPNERERIVALFSELYRLVSMLESEDQQVLLFREDMLLRLGNLFPLQLKISLFQPLLPHQHLFQKLALELSEQSAEKTQFEGLCSLASILPEEVTFEWVEFMHECLRRRALPSERAVHQILAKVDLQGDNVPIFAKLVCQLAEFWPKVVEDHLPLCIAVVQKHCEQPNDFSLALVAQLIRHLGEMIEPYLTQLIVACLAVDSTLMDQFIEGIVGQLTPSTLIKLTKQTHKKVENLQNEAKWLKAVAAQGVGDSLNQTLLIFSSRCLLTSLENEQNPSQIVDLCSTAFLNLTLKMNEHQLRKFIIELVRWSEMKSEISGTLPFNERKIVVARVYSLLAAHLQTLFLPFFGYVYQGFSKDLLSINKHYQKNTRESSRKQERTWKRQREENPEARNVLVGLYLELVLEALQRLFKQDRQHEFMDAVKIEALGDPLLELALLSEEPSLERVVYERLSPCLVAFHESIGDDYQMKTMNYKLLVMLKRKSACLQNYIFSLYENLVEALRDRFLLLVADLVSFLLEATTSRQGPTAASARRIIAKIEELSGEEITSYA